MTMAQLNFLALGAAFTAMGAQVRLLANIAPLQQAQQRQQQQANQGLRLARVENKIDLATAIR